MTTTPSAIAIPEFEAEPEHVKFQDSSFLRGYQMCRIKQGIDPIPNLLPGTLEYRKWMAGWYSALHELDLLHHTIRTT